MGLPTQRLKETARMVIPNLFRDLGFTDTRHACVPNRVSAQSRSGGGRYSGVQARTQNTYF